MTVLITNLTGSAGQPEGDDSRKFLEAVAVLENFMELNWTGPGMEKFPIFSETGTAERKFAVFAKCRRTDLVMFARRVFGDLAEEKFPTLPVWRARSAFALQRVLEEANDRGSGHDWELMTSSVRDFAIWLRSHRVISDQDLAAVLDSLPKAAPSALAAGLVQKDHGNFPEILFPADLQASLVCELANRLAYYNKLGAIDRLIDRASELAGFSFEVTGVEGMRRKYQTQSFAQLVCRTWGERSEQSATVSSCPRLVTLAEVEPETDILETVRVVEEEVADQRELTATQQLVLIAECGRVYYNSVEDDTLTLETVNALASRALRKESAEGHSADWLVFSGSLYWRCRAEHLRIKTQGRSSFQLEALVKQFHETSDADAHAHAASQTRTRTRFVYAVNYPSVWELERELGERMMQVGMVMTAYEQFKKLEMWQLAVECLAIAGRKTQALELIEEVRAKQADGTLPPLLLCALGDLNGTANPEEAERLYECAWEASAQSCARAKRSLGRLAIKKGDWENACMHFEDALAISALHADVWFSVGAAYMRLEQPGRATRAFVRSLGVNEDDWQAWANLSALYSRTPETMAQAKTAALEAVKRNKGSFKLWENVSVISMCLDDLQTAINAERYLVLSLRREDRPDLAVLRRIFMEARSRKLAEPAFFARVLNFFQDLADATHIIKAEPQARICLMLAQLEAAEVKGLDLAFRALRLAGDCLHKALVQESLELIHELIQYAEPLSVAALVMTVKAIPKRLSALGLSGLEEIESLCVSIRANAERDRSIAEEDE